MLLHLDDNDACELLVSLAEETIAKVSRLRVVIMGAAFNTYEAVGVFAKGGINTAKGCRPPQHWKCGVPTWCNGGSFNSACVCLCVYAMVSVHAERWQLGRRRLYLRP